MVGSWETPDHQSRQKPESKNPHVFLSPRPLDASPFPAAHGLGARLVVIGIGRSGRESMFSNRMVETQERVEIPAKSSIVFHNCHFKTSE